MSQYRIVHNSLNNSNFTEIYTHLCSALELLQYVCVKTFCIDLRHQYISLCISIVHQNFVEQVFFLYLPTKSKVSNYRNFLHDRRATKECFIVGYALEYA